MSIQHHFKVIVTQTVFLADLIEITIGLSVLFVVIMFWINTQISNNNQTIIELMKANITLTGLDLQTTIQSINFLFNITKISPTQQQSTTLITLQGTMSNINELAKIQYLSELYIPTIPYYIIDLDTQSIYTQNNSYTLSSFTTQLNCDNYPNYCTLMNQYNDYFEFMIAQRKKSQLFYTLFPSDLQLTQICGQVVDKLLLFQCFVLDLTDYKEPDGILYGSYFTINNSIISDVDDDCLIDELRCDATISLSEQNQQSTDDIVDFLIDINKTNWYDQFHSISTLYESSDPIYSLSVIDMKSYFYQSLSIGSANLDDEYENVYKEDLLNQTKVEYEKLQSLQQNFYRWQLLATFNNDLYDELIMSKQEDYFDFYLFFEFFILLLILTPILQNHITQSEFNQISYTLKEVSRMMKQFTKVDHETRLNQLIEFRMNPDITLQELKELMEVYYEFCWLIQFLEQLNKKAQDLDKLIEGLRIFDKRNSAECKELILTKLVAEYSRQKEYETAIDYNSQLIELQKQQKNQILIIKSEEIMRMNYKLFQSLNQLLDLLSKQLIRKKGKDRATWNQAKNLFSEIMDFADTLEIKFTLQIKLFFKKCKLLFNLRKIKEAEQCIDQAQQILQQNYTLSKQSHNKTFNQDKKLLQVVQQKIYFYRGLIFMSSGQHQPAIQQLMLALDYGTVYQQKLRVKTIKMISKLFVKKQFYEDSKTLKQIQYFYQNGKRLFNFLIDSTQRMGDYLNEISDTVKHVKDLMSEDDQIKITCFGDEINLVLETQSKVSFSELITEEDQLQTLLGKYQQQNHIRKLYNALSLQFEDLTPHKYTCYLILMVFGENYAEQSDLMNEVLDKLRDGYWHFILCSVQEKKYINQRNNFFRLTDEARDGTYIDLFANFEEGLSKITSLCS